MPAANADVRCYDNPISARAAGGVWLPKPGRIRACAGCGIPLTGAYAVHAGMLRFLCRLCRAKKPGLRAIPLRDCAGCGLLLPATRLHDGACSPPCARAIGVYMDCLPAPDAYYAAVKCAGYETCGTLVIIRAPRAPERNCPACAAQSA